MRLSLIIAVISLLSGCELALSHEAPPVDGGCPPHAYADAEYGDAGPEWNSVQPFEGCWSAVIAR